MRKTALSFILPLLASLFFVEALPAQDAADKPRLMLSLQKEKILDNSGNLRAVDRMDMIEKLHQKLLDRGFQVLDEGEMVEALKNAEKAELLGGMAQEGAGESMVAPRYYIQMAVSECRFLMGPERKRVYHMKMQLNALDARTGARIVSVANGEPVVADTVPLAIESCVSLMVEKFTAQLPEEFRPAALEGTVIKVAPGRILVKIDGARLKVGDVLKAYRQEEIDLGDGEFDMDETLTGFLTVTEVKTNFVACAPSTEDHDIQKEDVVRP
ncbi:MAG: DUF6175 family protein [Oligosphaeraceae bacterium]